MSINDPMNPNGFYSGGQSWPAAQPLVQVPLYGGYPQMPPRVHTNVEPVTSLEEAIIRSTMRNSDMFYIDQNKPLFYRIRVEADGRKSYMQLPYALPNQPDSTPATKADVQVLADKIARIESIVTMSSPVPTAAPEKSVRKKKIEEVVENVESNG